MRNPARWLPIWVLVALLSVPGSVDGQRRDGPADREEIEQRIRAQMGRMMQRRLGLDEEEAGRLSEVVRSFDDRRGELARREFETRRRVEELLEADGDGVEARELLEIQAELRMEEAQLFGEEQEALLGILSPAQVLELQDLRQDIGRRIRELRGRGRPQNGRFRGPGPDGRRGDRRDSGPRTPLG